MGIVNNNNDLIVYVQKKNPHRQTGFDSSYGNTPLHIGTSSYMIHALLLMLMALPWADCSLSMFHLYLKGQNSSQHSRQGTTNLQRQD